MITRRLLWAILLICIGCGGNDIRSQSFREWMIPDGKIKVLSTTAMINDLVKRVAGEHADTLTLIQGNLDPHSYQLVKGDDEKLSFADLIFYNGLGLEHGASLAHYLEKKPGAIPLGNRIQELWPEKVVFVNSQIDPHIWMDISLFADAIPIIVESLSLKDPDHRSEYEKRGQELQSDLLAVHANMKQRLQQIPSKRRYLVTSHDAFNYFARAYLADPSELTSESWRNRFQAPEGLAPDSQLSSADIQMTIDHLKKFQINVIFPESNVSQDSIRKIVQAGKEKGIDVVIAKDPLYGDAMGSTRSGDDTYPRMLLHNTEVLEKYLKNEF
jgi:manganese/zinc/iron transport system substrate-binding protein